MLSRFEHEKIYNLCSSFYTDFFFSKYSARNTPICLTPLTDALSINNHLCYRF